MSGAAVEREKHDGLTILRLCRPEQKNALTQEIKEALCALVPEFFAEPGARCLLITGKGEAFCAGGDLRTLAGGSTPEQTRARMAQSHVWASRLMTGEKPVIMAVNGAAVGAGFGLALLGDIVLASDSAYFVPGFSAIGVAADLGVALTLPRAVGVVRAKDILLRNRRLSAAEALGIGLVSAVHPRDALMSAAVGIGQQLAMGPTMGLGLTKTLINRSYDMPLEAFLAAETAAQTLTFASADCAEGVEAFFTKRPPRFRGV